MLHELHLIRSKNYQNLCSCKQDPTYQKCIFPSSDCLQLLQSALCLLWGAACRDMVTVSTFVLMMNSTSSTALAKFWGDLSFVHPNLRFPEQFWLSRMQQKISLELFNVSLSTPVFMGDSEIILRMIAKNYPATPPVFYGTQIMEITAVSNPDNWFWCPGPLNPADLLTRIGSTYEQINFDFWLHGSLLPQPEASWQ